MEVASALFNKVLVKVLSSHLAYYMNNFAKESFKLEVLKGTFSLADIGTSSLIKGKHTHTRERETEREMYGG